MNSQSPRNKKDPSLSPDRGDDEPSFISNIQIDVSGTDSLIDRSDITNSGITNSGITNSGSTRPRTTTLALDPRPFRRREKFYTIIITILTSTLLLLVGAILIISPYTPRKSELHIRIDGVESNRTLIEQRAEEFMRKHIGILILIESNGAKSAFAGLIEGKVQIVQTSLPLSSSERAYLSSLAGKNLQEKLVGEAALAIYVHKNNPLTELTLEQLKAIYAGELTNWQAVGGVDAPIAAYNSSYLMDSYTFFRTKVMGSTPISVSINPIASSTDLCTKLASDINSIGYSDSYLSCGDLRTLKLKSNATGNSESLFYENKLNTNYPLKYKNYWYFLEKPSTDTINFLDMNSYPGNQ